MKILVIGGSGYIGSILVPKLLNLGNTVFVVDNYSYNQTSLLPWIGNENLNLIRDDARNEELIKKLLKNVDVIFPLAALVGAPACDQQKFTAKTLNYDSIKMIVDNLSPNQKIIFPNTNSGYGTHDKKDIYTEDCPLEPNSLYGVLKQEAENLILESGNGISLRLASVFGISPCLRTELLVNDFTLKAVQEKSIVLYEAGFKRNFLHVSDAADAFIHCMENYESMNNNAYNCGIDDENLTKLELCELIGSIVEDFKIIKADIFKDPDRRDYTISHQKLADAGFKTKVSLKQGINGLVRAYKAYPVPHARVLTTN